LRSVSTARESEARRPASLCQELSARP
jgi:hypothetical protein